MEVCINDKVEVKSFLGLIHNDKSIDEKENYWKLIGCRGRVIQIKDSSHPVFPESGIEVLIKFDESIKELNLHNHSDEENTLWLFASDLKKSYV